MATKRKRRRANKPPHVLRPRKRSEMLIYTQPGFLKQDDEERKAALLRMNDPIWPRYTGTGDLVFTKLTPADVARMANIKSVDTVRRWLIGWTYRPNAETKWKIMTALMIPTGILPCSARPQTEARIFRISDYRLAQLRKAQEVEETGKKAPEGRRYKGAKVLPVVATG